jgi:hypothetical protein
MALTINSNSINWDATSHDHWLEFKPVVGHPEAAEEAISRGYFGVNALPAYHELSPQNHFKHFLSVTITEQLSNRLISMIGERFLAPKNSPQKRDIAACHIPQFQWSASQFCPCHSEQSAESRAQT